MKKYSFCQLRNGKKPNTEIKPLEGLSLAVDVRGTRERDSMAAQGAVAGWGWMLNSNVSAGAVTVWKRS